MTLIGATTENPFFEIISALLSRSGSSTSPLTRTMSRRFCDAPWTTRPRHRRPAEIADEALELLALASGDARTALNALEAAAETRAPGPGSSPRRPSTRCSARLAYDRQADDHYDYDSALIKSLRGSDPDAAFSGSR